MDSSNLGYYALAAFFGLAMLVVLWKVFSGIFMFVVAFLFSSVKLVAIIAVLGGGSLYAVLSQMHSPIEAENNMTMTEKFGALGKSLLKKSEEQHAQEQK